ncbi:MULTISPECIES: NAD(P)H-binding protein [unclassified Nocardiopsis]|uniref:NAD(P)H-binding protein n=1 Tax=unclassified Nocardiopsis TaxID=2649073 RepID=UPI001915AFEB|nr:MULTISPECIES: NAD(P)H-binding protein [unclassified Nocardiopsis]
MELLILGATGPTGRHVVGLALAAGDTVTVLARTPEALEGPAGQVGVIAGDATSQGDAAKAVTGQDAVISALGRGASVRADGLFTRAAAAVTGAAEEGVRPASCGCPRSAPETPTARRASCGRPCTARS